jgi:hypothetical protein
MYKQFFFRNYLYLSIMQEFILFYYLVLHCLVLIGSNIFQQTRVIIEIYSNTYTININLQNE